VRKLRGIQAAAAARLHIITGLNQEGLTEDQSFPRDEQHYQKTGLFLGPRACLEIQLPFFTDKWYYGWHEDWNNSN
jgi:hypothetical protein